MKLEAYGVKHYAQPEDDKVSKEEFHLVGIQWDYRRPLPDGKTAHVEFWLEGKRADGSWDRIISDESETWINERLAAYMHSSFPRWHGYRIAKIVVSREVLKAGGAT